MHFVVLGRKNLLVMFYYLLDIKIVNFVEKKLDW